MNTATIARLATSANTETRELALQMFLELDPIRAARCALFADQTTPLGGTALVNEATAYRDNSSYWRKVQRLKAINERRNQCGPLFSRYN